MRIAKVERGHTLPQKLLLTMIRTLSGFEAPDVVKTLMYRKGYFGNPQRALTQAVMRGPSQWSVGEREIFAAFVSRLNQCVF